MWNSFTNVHDTWHYIFTSTISFLHMQLSSEHSWEVIHIYDLYKIDIISLFFAVVLLLSVPFIMTGGLKFKEITHNAALCDVATTVLDVMGLPIPQEMTGQSLLAK